MDFYEWKESDGRDAREFRERIKAGEEGNKLNPLFAAELAFKAGIKEGIERSANKLRLFLTEA